MNSITRSLISKVQNSRLIPIFSSIIKSNIYQELQFKNLNILPVLKMSTDSKLVVEHDQEALKFFIRLGKDEAKLEYAKNGDVLNMWHTEVPNSLQGKGIAKILAQEAFAYAVQNNLKMLLTCTYLQKFYNDNPKEEYKRLVV